MLCISLTGSLSLTMFTNQSEDGKLKRSGSLSKLRASVRRSSTRLLNKLKGREAEGDDGGCVSDAKTLHHQRYSLPPILSVLKSPLSTWWWGNEAAMTSDSEDESD